MDDATVVSQPGGFAAGAELLVVSSALAEVNADTVARALGAANEAYAVGQTVLVAATGAESTTLFRFTAQDDDAVISAAELAPIAVLVGASSFDACALIAG
ncbi:hypothetical protein [Pseudoduganella armeniaca]|uniref:Uncharacterized protein n=1 Tax=Pseudoduganella armeniaca TaxID=2072590 RepID=A0A2R4CDU1_9BURK|nr:hypothetical protein [Pseudoduganella armeniaca]AVR97638.1 hypothetical protein C9I28_19870 [Pseudoduganella armeniaca]